MENKLDLLTKKLYDEGIIKAQREAATILEQARREAEKILADARQKADATEAKARQTAESLQKRAGAEMELSARQALAVLKQEISALVSGNLAVDMAEAAFEDSAFVRELLMTIVKRWAAASGNIDLEILLPANEKERFEAFVAAKYKELLDRGLEIKTGPQTDAFLLQPRDGSYRITFSEPLLEAFFKPYLKGLAKELLYKQ